ncbi:MAG: hypothetical protein PUF11_04105 [Parafannyhessea umbonata]|uniref:hypothetical protein n=1 Tax=Parafannyhessea umbonata TaxID=604330 RepID=UPI0026EF24CE|nr:hypothetical protein [Parafannyhessea umbonata]MDD6565956.1 hypothetical protein [Parafannyhessea umbonata]
MKPEYLRQMSREELDQYASIAGYDLGKARSVDAKVSAIQEAREHVAAVKVLGGLEIEIPISRMHDKRLSDLLAKQDKTDDDVERLFVGLVGEDQAKAVEERCTDDDGAIDVDAYSLAIAQVLHARAAKNF